MTRIALIPALALAGLAAGSITPLAQSSGLGFSFTNVAQQAGLSARTVYGGKAHQHLPHRNDGDRRGGARLRRRRVARHLPRQRHHARRVSQGPGTDEPPLSEPRERHVRRRDGARGPGGQWVGTGCVRRRLRQRRPRRSVRHLLGPEPALPQPGQRHVRGRHAPRRGRQRPQALELGVRLSRLRPRRTPRPLRRQLHRPRSLRDAAAILGPVPLQGAARSRAVRRDCPAARTCSIAIAATARSPMSRRPSGITRANGTYALGVGTLDFDGDGWIDLYVANDSNPSALYRNNRNGTFTDIATAAGCAYSQDGKAQAGMGLAIGDYDRNGTMDIFKTNFAGDTSTLYANTGKGLCEDRTFAAGFGLNTRWLGWGVELSRPRQRRLAGSLPRQRPRVSRGPPAQDRSRLRTAQGRLPQPAQRPLRRRQRAAWRAGHDAEGRPRRGVCRLRQRRRRRYRRQQPARHARSLPARSDRASDTG